MKTQGVINPLGEIIAHDVTFEPNVNVYDRTASDGIERVIRIECPGVQQEDIDWEAGTGYDGARFPKRSTLKMIIGTFCAPILGNLP